MAPLLSLEFPSFPSVKTYTLGPIGSFLVQIAVTRQQPEVSIYHQQRYKLAGGRRAADREMRKLTASGIVEIAQAPQFFLPDEHGHKNTGRSTIYRVNVDAVDQLTLKMTDERYVFSSSPHLTESQRQFFETMQRTNIPGKPYLIHGRNGDTRTYTNFSLMPKVERAGVLLDGEPLIGLDISNCHMIAFARHLPRRVKQRVEFVQLVETGELYDRIASDMGIDRKEAKLALLKAFNSPYVLRFQASGNKRLPWESLVQSPYLLGLRASIHKRLAWKWMVQQFPSIARLMRHEARTSTPWHYANQFEGSIRRELQAQWWSRKGYWLLDCHDCFYVKESDRQALESLFVSLFPGVPFSVSASCSGSLASTYTSKALFSSNSFSGTPPATAPPRPPPQGAPDRPPTPDSHVHSRTFHAQPNASIAEGLGGATAESSGWNPAAWISEAEEEQIRWHVRGMKSRYSDRGAAFVREVAKGCYPCLTDDVLDDCLAD